ncbi:hypothetical protein Q757_03305 [Oenococcus alcoholitolerans]|uniref:tRNA synthetases class I catalytic domain-containing protein n=1 Tax=Oenococcus alcoholitolerans TaxID=931074 RepID=A0ABR4XRG8_9LACO|nr:hypothetical protein Q757_03305 [Oenococcus alcoholitolerans]
MLFRVRKFPDYGILTHESLDDLEVGASGRLDDADQDLKEDPLDFALWKMRSVQLSDGILLGAKAVRAGISNVLSCRQNI